MPRLLEKTQASSDGPVQARQGQPKNTQKTPTKKIPKTSLYHTRKINVLHVITKTCATSGNIIKEMLSMHRGNFFWA